MQRAARINSGRGSVAVRALTVGVAAMTAVGLAAAPSALAAGGGWAPGFHGGSPVVQLLAGYVDTPTVAAAGSLTYVASDSYPGTPGTTLQRLTATGVLDPAWSGDGVLTLATVPQVLALHPNSDGTLLIGGLDASGDALVGRLRANGTWDTTFSADGRVVLPVDSFHGVRSLAVDSRGRLLVALTAQRTNITLKTDFVVVRLRPTGRLDTTFGLGGYATVDTRRIDTVRAVTVDRHDRVLVMGATDADPNVAGYAPLVVRLTASGRVDPTYGTKGRAYPSYGTGTGQVVLIGHADRSDRLTVAVSSDAGAYGTVRLTAAGKLDKTYGTNGRTGASCACVVQAATWSAGMVLAVTSPDATLLRTVKVTAAGGFAAGWGSAGTADAPLPTGVSVNGTSLAPAPNGSVAVAGNGFQDDGMGTLTDAVLVARLSGR